MAKKLMRVNVSLPMINQAIVKLGADENGDVQQRLTDEIYRNLPDFMPKRSGALIASMKEASPTLIRVSSQHARAMYFGKKRRAENGGGPFPIGGGEFRYRRGARPKLTEEDLSYSNPDAGPYWDRRMVAARGKAIAAKVERCAKKRGKI